LHPSQWGCVQVIAFDLAYLLEGVDPRRHSGQRPAATHGR